MTPRIIIGAALISALWFALARADRYYAVQAIEQQETHP